MGLAGIGTRHFAAKSGSDNPNSRRAQTILSAKDR
jgi:hypothetical protein